MIAVGAINWDYQRSHANAALHSLIIIIPGLILLGLTFSASGRKLLQIKAITWAWAIIGISALIYAFINK